MIEQNIFDYKKVLVEEKKENEISYVNIHQKLNHSLEKVYPSIKFVYTFYKKNDKILFGIDASKLGDNDHDGVEDHAFAHTEYDKASNDLKTKFKEQKDFYTDFYSDNWGTFLSYYNPIFTENKEFLGFIGVDLEVKNYLNDLNEIKIISLYLFCLLEVVLLMGLFFIKKYLDKYQQTEEQKKEIEFLNLSKLATIGEVSSIIAHEINNPLQLILGNLELIEMLIESNPTMTVKEIESQLKLLVEMSNKISQITTNVKKMTRNDSKNDFVISSPSDLISDIESMFVPSLESKGITYLKEILTESRVKVLPVQFYQIILNLVSNSSYEIKNKEKKWIKIKVFEEKEIVKFQIIDSGPGLTKDIQEKIKSKFFTSKPNGEGSVLGLSIVRKIVENHGGQFYYNEKEPNTCFEFTLEKAS